MGKGFGGGGGGGGKGGLFQGLAILVAGALEQSLRPKSRLAGLASAALGSGLCRHCGDGLPLAFVRSLGAGAPVALEMGAGGHSLPSLPAGKASGARGAAGGLAFDRAPSQGP
mmetsp:Transcript_45985/g.146853  ORF Transcript_45985/g.146853 Transcript_45985/m.146853 type:complete len:113 (+) Transcript_45985:846-1184(+)